MTQMSNTLLLLIKGSPYSAGYVPPPAVASSHLTLASHLACQNKWIKYYVMYSNLQWIFAKQAHEVTEYELGTIILLTSNYNNRLTAVCQGQPG